ncbi:B12-binding domain-containing protein [Jannaschia sp. M317]|uniref:cobalamin B12-binding domain-containing protein n=1 Tax=Jannaschia sp. M317 TaxID=2867011 RepID=UPI0021A2A4B1|nr:cobalamin B12-binding domain-containing protein [Jannaschia sp. M317]UWQ18354.1 cobalamin B12-binding domain-containing protein [Jannaschia sp. M317]
MAGKIDMAGFDRAGPLPARVESVIVRVATHAGLQPQASNSCDALSHLAEGIFLHPEDGPRRQLLHHAKGDIGLAHDLIGTVFPRVARRLEEGWNHDRLSFAEVTIAATRLQDAVRNLGARHAPSRGPASLVMIVPAWEQHTLPAFLASEHMRRLGVPVRLLSGVRTDELLALTARAAPDAILVSAGSYRSVARMPDLFTALRRAIPRAVPIVLGGPAMEANFAECHRAGADLATSNLGEALRYCDLDVPVRIHKGTLCDV